MELPYDPAILLLAIYPKNMKTLIRYMHPYVDSSIIHDSQTMEAVKCPSIDEWIKKVCVCVCVCVCVMEYYSTTKNSEILPFSTPGTELERIMLSEIS